MYVLLPLIILEFRGCWSDTSVLCYVFPWQMGLCWWTLQANPYHTLSQRVKHWCDQGVGSLKHLHESDSSLDNRLLDLETLKSSGADMQQEGGTLPIPSFSRESMYFLRKIIHVLLSIRALITCHYLAAIGWGPVSRAFGGKGPKWPRSGSNLSV